MEEIKKAVKFAKDQHTNRDLPLITRKYLYCHAMLNSIEPYDEVVEVVFDMLKEVERQVKRLEGELSADATTNILESVMQKHGWIEGDEDE